MDYTLNCCRLCGATWRRIYHEDRLVEIRCENGHTPIEQLRKEDLREWKYSIYETGETDD